VLKHAELETYLADASEGTVPVIKDSAGNAWPTQQDDLDGDGQWDELSSLADFEAGETKKVYIDFVAKDDLPNFPVRTNIRFAAKKDGTLEELKDHTRPDDHTKAKATIHYQMEGPAWENDIVAFRTYFDPRNGFDIFGKKTNEMVLDQVGTDSDESYHTLQDWGMDVLKVGESLGAGALALAEGDSMVRLGYTQQARYRFINEGPVRAIFEIDYTGWDIGGQSIDLTRRIELWAGSHGYKSTVTLSGFDGRKNLMTGIVNLDSDSLISLSHAGHHLLATHDDQAYEGEKLGMALLIPDAVYSDEGMAPEEGAGIVQTYYTTLKAPADEPVSFYFFVGWERQDAAFQEATPFINLLKDAAEKLNNPLKIALD
jgi:hypothetical protein